MSVDLFHSAYSDASSRQDKYYKIIVTHTNSPPTWTFPPILIGESSVVLGVQCVLT